MTLPENEDGVVTREEAMAAAGRVLAEARAQRDALPVREAALAAHVPGGPSVEDLVEVITAQRERAQTPTPPAKDRATRTAQFIGGPLDGQHAEKTKPGRWPIYRDDEGAPITTREGDREFQHYDPDSVLTRYYRHQMTAVGNQFAHVYVHATAWRAWLDAPSEEEAR